MFSPVDLIRAQMLHEQLEDRETFYEFNDPSRFPRRGPERIHALERWIKENCRVSAKAEAPALKTVWLEDAYATGDRRAYPVRALIPVEDPAESRHHYHGGGYYGEDLALLEALDGRRSGRGAMQCYFSTWKQCDSPVNGRDIPELERRLLKRLNEKQTNGRIELRSRKIRIFFGCRRPEKISDSDICALLFIEERKDREGPWSAASIKPALYAKVVAPHFRGRPRGTPFEWAAERLKIVHGMSQTLVGKDFPLLAAEAPYQETARIVCNLHRPRHDRKVLFERTGKAETLLEALGPQPLPEAAYLVLALQDHLTPRQVRTHPLRSYLEKLPRYLENGLCVDRVAELVRELRGANGARVQQALQALRITDAVFGTAERPWWFHEDQSFIPAAKSAGWGSRENLRAHRLLAARCGPVYQYAKDVWETSGVELVKFNGVTPENAIELVAAVARDFGIGNVARANNVLTFARAALAEAAPGERAGLCRTLQESFHANRPRSELIGALEGSDTAFEKPGLAGILNNLAREVETGKRGLFALTFRPEHVRLAVAAAAKPLKERARVAPVLRINHEPQHRFITQVTEAGVLALPVPEEYALLGPAERPLHTWLDFDRRLREEVPARDRSAVADLYLTFFAQKMPLPFQPPKGFLSIVQRLSDLYDPDFQPAFMAAPWEREQRGRENAAAQIDRWALVGSWLDTAVLGLQSYDQVMDTLLWVLVDQGNPFGAIDRVSADKRELQVTGLWQHYWNDKQHQKYAREERLSEHDAELRKTQEMLEDLERVCLHCAYQNHDSQVYLILEGTRDQLDEIRKRRINLVTDWQRRVSGDQDESLEELAAEQDFFYAARSFLRGLKESGAAIAVDAKLIEWTDKQIEELWERRQRLNDRYHGYGFLGLPSYDLQEGDEEEEQALQQPREKDAALAEQERQFHHDITWSGEAGELLHKEMLERLRQLGRTMEFLTCLNGLIASGSFPPQTFRSAFEQTVKGLKAGTLRFDKSPLTVLEDLQHTAQTLKEIKDYGLADVEKVEAALAAVSSPSDLIEILGDVSGLVNPYREVRELIGRELQRGSGIHNSAGFSTYVNEGLTERIRAMLNSGSQYFVANAAELMLDEFFWLERYRIVTPHLMSFMGTLPAPSLNGRWTEVQPTLDNAYRMVSLAWMFGEASKVLRVEGREAFERAATPESLTKLLTTADGPALLAAPGAGGQRPVEQLVEEALATAVLPPALGGAALIPQVNSSQRLIPFHLAGGLDGEFQIFKERLVECRRRDFGLLATGGKVHVIHEIDSYRLNFLRNCYGFRHTSFMVDNASHMVVLPPTSSASEIQLIAQFLNAESIIDWEFPEIQMCMASRLRIGNCAILGASIMAVTDVNVPYNEDSFGTRRDDATAFRIMIYDDYGERNKFPFDVTRLGRTDMLGRRTLGDFKPWQLIGSVLAYSEEPLDGSNTTITREHLERFHGLAFAYKRSFKNLLERHGLQHVLGELWLNPIYLDRAGREGDRFKTDKEGGQRHFRRAVKPMMDAWNACADQAEKTGKMEGLVGEAKALAGWLANSVRSVQEDMLQSSYYARHRDQLFCLDR